MKWAAHRLDAVLLKEESRSGGFILPAEIYTAFLKDITRKAEGVR